MSKTWCGPSPGSGSRDCAPVSTRWSPGGPSTTTPPSWSTSRVEHGASTGRRRWRSATTTPCASGWSARRERSAGRRKIPTTSTSPSWANRRSAFRADATASTRGRSALDGGPRFSRRGGGTLRCALHRPVRGKLQEGSLLGGVLKGDVDMARPITLFSGQWADLPFAVLCQKARAFGFDGIELACQGEQMDARRAATDLGYVEQKKGVLREHRLQVFALGGHIAGQCVGDHWDPRLDAFAPPEAKGNPEKIRAWAIQEMKHIARAAKAMGVSVVTGFMGSPAWRYWYAWPPTSEQMIDDAFQEIVRLWTPIFDEFDACGVRFALEVHPTEIAFDFYTAERLLAAFRHRPTLGFNFDPSHLQWQGMKPHLFVRDFAKRIFHVHMKDCAVRLDGRSGILGSHLPFGDPRRGWDFRSLGHGDVDFDEIIRALNAAGYQGPLSVEWEDSGMDREAGAREALEFVRRIDFAPSSVAFDAAMKK